MHQSDTQKGDLSWHASSEQITQYALSRFQHPLDTGRQENQGERDTSSREKYTEYFSIEGFWHKFPVTFKKICVCLI